MTPLTTEHTGSPSSFYQTSNSEQNEQASDAISRPTTSQATITLDDERHSLYRFYKARKRAK